MSDRRGGLTYRGLIPDDGPETPIEELYARYQALFSASDEMFEAWYQSLSPKDQDRIVEYVKAKAMEKKKS